MTSELDFIAALDAEPGNHWLRQVYADFLEENGSELASGMRALGLLGKRPDGISVVPRSTSAWYDASEPVGIDPESDLPRAWFRKLIGGKKRTPRQRRYASRSEAFSAAALAWLRLTDAERAKIMAEAGVKV